MTGHQREYSWPGIQSSVPIALLGATDHEELIQGVTCVFIRDVLEGMGELFFLRRSITASAMAEAGHTPSFAPLSKRMGPFFDLAAMGDDANDVLVLCNI
jgi:hypothetical protein